MRDLLFLAHRLPYPPNKGDKIRSWHFLKHLASRYRVHLGCFFDDPDDARYIDLLGEICETTCCLPLSPATARIWALSCFLSGQPLTTGYFADRRLAKWVLETVNRTQLDRIYVFCSAMVPYVANLQHIRRILDMIDIDSEKWRQYSQSRRGPTRLIWSREARTLLTLERHAASIFDATVLVSETEAEAFRRLAGESAHRIHAVKNGVDVDYFNPEIGFPNPLGEEPAIVFTGLMNYWPNIDAVTWFATEVMPLLRLRTPAPTFWIVGSNPTSAVKQLSLASDIRVTGRVEDVRPYLAHASAVVAPLRIACGIPNKVLEAMAMAAPVVVTSQAIEGLEIRANAEVLVADSALEFARHTALILCRKIGPLGLAARSRVKSDYSWSTAFKLLDKIIEGDDSTGQRLQL